MDKYLSLMVPRQSGKKSPLTRVLEEYSESGQSSPMMKALSTHLSAAAQEIPIRYLSKKDRTKAIKEKYNLSHGKGKRKKRK